MTFTPADLAIMQARLVSKGASPTRPPSKAVERERDLHEAIKAECQRRGWIAFSGSMAHRAHRTVGEPDFIILTHDGGVLLVEAKTRTGKLRPEQRAIAAWAAKLGHTVHVVRSIEEFMNITNQPKGNQ